MLGASVVEEVANLDYRLFRFTHNQNQINSVVAAYKCKGTAESPTDLFVEGDSGNTAWNGDHNIFSRALTATDGFIGSIKAIMLIEGDVSTGDTANIIDYYNL